VVEFISFRRLDESPTPAKRPGPCPLLVAARRLAPMLDVGLRTVRSWDAAGKLPAPLRISGKVLWRVDEISDWLAAGAPDRKTWEARGAASRGVSR